MSLPPALYYFLAFTVLTHALYRIAVVLYNAYLSPLAKVPNAHPSVPFSSAWILWNKWHLRENRARHAAHQKLGPIIRIGPKELSIDCIEDGVRSVYGSWDKHSWYTDALQGDGAPYMLTMLSHSMHAGRRRLVASAYSKSAILNSPRVGELLQHVIDSDLMSKLSQASATSEALEVLALNKSVYLDMATAWIFGSALRTNFVVNEEARHEILNSFNTESSDFFLRSEFAWLTTFLGRFKTPGKKHDMFSQGSFPQRWIAGLCKNAELATAEKAESSMPQDAITTPTVFELLRQGLKDAGASQDEINRSLRAECLDHILASYEVSGVVLTYLMYELSLRPALQAQLRAELLDLGLPSQSTPQEIDSLALLDAILLETLRMYPSVLGPWPRVAPAAGARLGPYDGIPAGTKVSASSWTLHMHAEVFPEPEQWRPKRWLSASKENRVDMTKWLWPYGSGSRVCIGNHFANRSLKYIVASVYRGFETSICEHASMEPVDAMISGPTGGHVKLFFAAVKGGVHGKI